MYEYTNSVIERFEFSGRVIEIQLGDITEVTADVIVSSDDNHITMGGGVSLSILNAGGEEIWNESRKYVPAQLGTAVVTPAGRLHAKYVFHAIVIDFDQGIWPNGNVVQSATTSCFTEAERLNCRTLALPALGTGAGGLVSETTAQAMISAILKALKQCVVLQKVIIVLNRRDTLFDFFKYALEKTIKEEYEEKLEALRRDKEKLLTELREKTPYQNLPFPIAVTRRIIEGHSVFHSKFTATIECAESVVRYCGAIVLAEQLRIDPTKGRTLFKYFNRYANFGSWIEKLEEALHFLKGNESTFSIIPEIQAFYFSKHRGHIRRIKEIRDEKHGHGGTLSDSAYKDLYEGLICELDATLEGLAFMTEYPLIVVTQTDVREMDFEYQIVKLMGDNVIFTKDTLHTTSLRLAKDTPYILDERRQQVLSLPPFLIFETCPNCHIQETFFLEHTSSDELTYHTHRANHRLYTKKYLERFTKTA